MVLRIGRAVRRANEDTYADSDDFPTRFGEKIQWLPTGICVLMAVNFFIDERHPQWRQRPRLRAQLL